MSASPLHFGSYRLLAAGIAQRLLASRGSDPLAPWSEEVIVASAGVAQAIDRELLERSGAVALRGATHTIETLAARIVNASGEFPRVANDAERRLAMRTAARALAEPLMETRGTAAMLERSYRDVRDSATTIRALARKASGVTALRNRERLRTVIRAWEEYERLIAAIGCIDPADLLARAAELVAAGAPVPPQILAGFYDMTGAQMAFVGALRAVEKLGAVYVPVERRQNVVTGFSPSRDGLKPVATSTFAVATSTFAVATSAFADPFIANFSSLIPHPSSLEEQPRWTITEYKTREEEIRGVCAAVKRLLEENVPPRDIAIVARSLEPYDLHLFERFANEHGFTTTDANPVPLAAHRIGRAVALLLRLRERDFPRSDVLEILRGGLNINTRINVDKADAETRSASIAGGAAAVLRGRKTRSFAVGDYIDAVAELEEITARIDGRLMARLAGSFRIENESDVAACAALDEIADLFVRAEKWNRPADAASILDALEQVQLKQPATGNQQPVIWTGDVMRFRGRSFQHLFAVRMQDDVLPQRRNEDPLLPDADRRLLGIREIGTGREEEQLLFHILRNGSPSHVHFSSASSDGFGKPLRVSHSVKRFALEQRPDEKQQILEQFSRWVAGCQLPVAGLCTFRQPATGNRQLRPLQLLARAGRRSAFDGYITSGAVLTRARAALESISPTHLEDFGECPQKFLLKYVLRVREVDDPEREVQINHREKGTLDHRILERFYRSLTPEEIAGAAPMLPRLAPELVQRLETIIDEEFDELEQRAPAHNAAMRAIERRATARVLRRFIAADFADLIANQLVPAHFEYRFGAPRRDRVPNRPEPFLIEVNGVTLRVEGTIDRVDRGPDTLRIVDYKSGKALRHEDLAAKIDQGVRLQLPLYAMAAAEFFDTDPSHVSGTIKPLAPTDTDPESFAFSLGEKSGRLGETLRIFVDAILRGAFPAFPNENAREFHSCKYCPVNHSCRTRHDPEESRAVLGAGAPRSLLQSEVAALSETER